MPNDRDTRFSKAATLLLSRLMGPDNDIWKYSSDEQHEIVAQSLWDFMYHVTQNVDFIILESGTQEALIEVIPDMAEWPEVDDELQQKIADWINFKKKMKKRPQKG